MAETAYRQGLAGWAKIPVKWAFRAARAIALGKWI